MLHTVLVQVLVDSVTIKHANEARAVVRQALDRDTQPELVGYTIIDAVASDSVGGIDVRYRKNPTPRHTTERKAHGA